MTKIIDYGVKKNVEYSIKLITIIVSTVIVSYTYGLTIEPNHDKPCIVGDAWAEECMSCVCSEGRIAMCKPSFCSTRLKRDLDTCKNDEIIKIDCNTCKCKNNVRICTKYDCEKDSHINMKKPKFKNREKKRKKLNYLL